MRRQAGFTLLHLVVGVALLAYFLSFSVPVGFERAGLERSVAGTQAGIHTLSAAARAHFLTQAQWPTLAEARESVSTQTGGFLSEAHPLGGAYQLTPRATAGANWRAGGLSIAACGITLQRHRTALAVRLGHRAAIDGDCVRLEIAPFGAEPAHLASADDGGGRLFADVGIDGAAAAHGPAPWTGGMSIEASNVPGGAGSFVERSALRGNGDLEFAGTVSSAGGAFGTERPAWTPTPPHAKPNPYPSGADATVGTVEGDLRLVTDDPLSGRVPGDLTREVDWEVDAIYAKSICGGESC